MVLNPFEGRKNQYRLDNILEHNGFDYAPKREYREVFGETLDYDVLVKAIDDSIDWHILTTGSYQGDYWYIGLKDNKIYFVNIGYGSCSGCDALLATDDDIQGLVNLQNSIKSDIREFESFEELISWIVNCNEWWLSAKEEVLNFIKKEFNIDFDIVATVKLK